MKRYKPMSDNLTADVGHVGIDGVRRCDVSPGDVVFVSTYNSTYRLRPLEGGDYLVVGGWFERQRMSPTRMAVAGCTWGGTAVKSDLIAARGMCLEFGNRLVTSPIRSVCVFRNGTLN